MTDIDAYQQQVEAKLNEWGAEIARLKAEAEQASAETKAEYQQQLDLLSARLQDAQTGLQELLQVSGEHGDELKQELDEALTALAQSFEQARASLPQDSNEGPGRAEGMAELRDSGSEGEMEGLGQQHPGSEGWAEGLGHPEPDSIGRSEEMLGQDKGSQRNRDRLLGDNLMNKVVISLNEGRIVGKVKAFYLDWELTRITAVQLGSEGLFHRKFSLVRQEDISLFGVDTVLVNKSQAVTTSNEVTEFDTWLPLDKLRGREVDTPGGTKIGTIGDIIFDDKGHLLAFKLARLFVEGPLAETQQIAREAILDTGREDGIITVDLAKAEQQSSHWDEVA